MCISLPVDPQINLFGFGKRQEIFRNLQKELLVESPWVWTFRSDDYYLVGSGVHGFTPRPDELLRSLTTVS